MKNKILSVLSIAACLALMATVAITSGCANAKEKSHTGHIIKLYGETVPAGHSAVIPEITNTPAGNQIQYFTVTAPGTNQTGFFANLTAPRPHRFLAFEETWDDTSSGGGTFLLTDPSASALDFAHTNQIALGGGRATHIGTLTAAPGTNDVALVNAVGTAAGNIVGQALETAAGVPSVSLPASTPSAITATNVISSLTNAPAATK